LDHFSNTANALSLLFDGEGFSYCVRDENGKQGKVSKFKVTHSNRWEAEVVKELEVNLKLRRNYRAVSTGFVSTFFNLVPDSYLNISHETLLNLSEAEFENNAILTSPTRFGNTFVYGISQTLLDKLKEFYPSVSIHHSGQVFMDSIKFSKQPELHLNLCQNYLEVVVNQENRILFYNLFEVKSDEDILFYGLFVLEQLGLDANKIELKCYGQLLPGSNVYQLLKKYIRFIAPAIKDEEILENYTLHNLSQCASSQEISEEKR